MYFFAIQDTLLVLVKSQLSLADKLINLQKLLSYDITKEIFSADTTSFGLDTQTKQALLQGILRWLQKLAKYYTQKHAPLLTAIYSELNPDFAQLVSTDHVLWYMQKIPEVLADLAARDYWAASKTLEAALRQEPVHVIPASLAQVLAALLQNQEAYIFYSKRLIGAMIQNNMYDDAEAELADWEQMLPDDPDIASLREQYIAKKSGAV